MNRCHTCNSAFVICHDVFGRAYCYDHARRWIDHLAAVVESGDVHRWCEHGGLAGPAAMVVADEERTESAGAEAPAQDTADEAGSGLRRMEGTGMLVLSRKLNECVMIGDDVVVQIVYLKGERVGIGIAAPADVRILRSELERHDDTATTLSR